MAGKNLITLRTNDAKYVSADPLQANTGLVANRSSAASWETFQLIDLGGGSIALRAQSSMSYVSADLATWGSPLVANRSAVEGWEIFQVVAR